MGEAFLQMLPFAIAGAFLPTWTSRVIVLLATDRPIGNGFAFVLGNAVFRFGFGVAFIYILNDSRVEDFTEGGGSLNPWIFVVAGVLLWALAAWSFFKPSTPDDEVPGWMNALERVPPIMAFGYGMFLVALPGIQYAYFIGGIGVISSAGLSDTEMIVLLLIFVGLLQVMLLAPTVIYIRKKEKAEVTFVAIKNWLARNGDTVTAVMLTLFGFYSMFAAWKGFTG